MTNAPSVTVLIPVYSEVESVPETVHRVCSSLPHQIVEILLIVHQDSSAACWDACRNLEASHKLVKVHLQQQYPGQGYAYREGISRARGRYLLMLNSDLETEPFHAARLLEEIENRQLDLVVASRWAQGADFDWRSYGLLRWLLNYAVQQSFARLCGLPISDLTFAYKIARSRLLQSIRWQGTGHEFALESTLKPALLGYRLGQVPTSWKARREGLSHQPFWRNLRHIFMGLRLCWEKRLHPQRFRSDYLRD